MRHADILHRCFRCGYCKLPGNYADFNCPAYLERRFETYSPGGRMWLIRAWLEGRIKTSPRLQDILFSCTACGNCVEQCTLANIKDQLLMAFTAGKEQLLAGGAVPPAVRDCLERLQKYGNPYGVARRKRADWAVSTAVAAFAGQDHLFWVGDEGAYDPRGQQIARSVAGLMARLGVSFGILGADEVSDGNEAKAMGEYDLFEELAATNTAAFAAAGAGSIIALSPHGFNALKNDYPKSGGALAVQHYTQVVAARMAKARFRDDGPAQTVTYHDSCYLGRHNKEYWSARKVLAAVPGLKLVEMERNLQNALCCGGGGGNLVTGILGSGADAAARVRVREAVATGAQVLAVACPTCAIMFEEAVKQEKLEGCLQVREISEIVAERMA